MAGFVSHRATTSFVVRELDLDPDTYAALLFESLKMGGWVNEGSPEDVDFVRSWAEEHIAMASDLPTETPLQAHGDGVSLKPIKAR